MSKDLQLLDTPVKRLVAYGSPVVAVGSVAFAASVLTASPLFFIIFMVFALGGGLKMVENYLQRDSGTSDEIADGFSPVSYSGNMGEDSKHQSEYDCDNYAQTSFDLKMANEGVISIQDVATCADAGRVKDYCLLCQPILKRQKQEIEAAAREAQALRKAEHEKSLREARQRTEERARERDETLLAEMNDAERQRVLKRQQAHIEHAEFIKTKYDKLAKRRPRLQQCQKCKEYTLFEYLCPTHSLDKMLAQDENDRLAKVAAKKAEAAAKRAEKKRLFEERRHVNLNGLALYRPDGVPEGAVPSLLHGRDIDPLATHSFIVWKWTEDGQSTKFYKEPVVVDAYSVHSDQGQVKSWYSVTDGNGRYVGDYSTVNGHLPKERHELVLKAHFKDESTTIEPQEYRP